MGMLDSASAGPILGNEDGRMMQDPDQDQDTDMVPCPACQGSGMVPADQAENPDMMSDMGEHGAPPSGPPPSSSPDMQGMNDYESNRPAQLRHQPLDKSAALASGRRVRERMRQGGRLGGF